MHVTTQPWAPKWGLIKVFNHKNSKNLFIVSYVPIWAPLMHKKQPTYYFLMIHPILLPFEGHFTYIVKALWILYTYICIQQNVISIWGTWVYMHDNQWFILWQIATTCFLNFKFFYELHDVLLLIFQRIKWCTPRLVQDIYPWTNTYYTLVSIHGFQSNLQRWHQ